MVAKRWTACAPESPYGMGMAHHHRLASVRCRAPVPPVRDTGTSAAARAHGTDGNHRDARFELRMLRAQQPKVGARRPRPARPDASGFGGKCRCRRNTTTSTEYSAINLSRSFSSKWGCHRIQVSRQSGRITAPGNVGNLSGSESDYPILKVVAKADVEIVEVTTSRTKNQYLLHDTPRLTLYLPSP